MSDPFYESREWLQLRYQALKRSNGRCACCGHPPRKGNSLHVDHIKPRSKHPELALVLDNLQVLCGNCNLGKSNTDQTDWRTPENQRQPSTWRRTGPLEQFMVPRNVNRRSGHIWKGDDTACRMWATGGIRHQEKYILANSLRSHPLCEMCRHNEAKARA
jgi:hypothetical protein